MSTLRTNNLQNPDSAGVNIVMTEGGGVIFSGIATAQSGLNLTGNSTFNGVITARDDIHVTSGSVGIGTDDPQHKLNVYNSTPSNTGGILVQNVYYGNNQDKPYLTVGTTNWDGSTNSSWNTFGFQHRVKSNSAGTGRITVDTSGGERFCIDNGGNVGIGTDNPNSAAGLDVLNGEICARGVRSNSHKPISGVWLGKAPEGNTVIEIVSDTGLSAEIDFSTPSTDTKGRVAYDLTNDYMYFNTNGANERLRITSTGNIGIGTTNPEYKLHLQDGQLIIKGSTEGGPYLYRDGGNGCDIVFHASRGTIASPTASANTDLLGNINFAGYDGSGYPRRASINGVVDGAVSGNTVPTAIIFRTGTNATPTERLRITSGGDIQIKDDIRVTFGDDGASDSRIYYSAVNDFLDIGLKNGSKINIFNLSDTDNYMQFYLETNTAQIGDTFSGTTDKQYIYFGNPNGSSDPGFIMHETRGAESNEGIIHLCPSDDNQDGDYVSIHGTNDPDVIRLQTNGNISTPGSISKGSGSFSIPHPLAGLSTTNNLVHSFVEAPDASNLYAGMVDLVDGTATVNIDTAHRMTEGTFVALNHVQSWSSSNESGYSPVKCSISGNLLTIECQDTSSTDTVYYEVRGIRKDQHMIDAHWTDENGRVITEPLQ